MRKLIPMVAATFLVTTASASLAVASDCAALLPPMAVLLQSMRDGAAPSADEQETWRVWTAQCRSRQWQDQLAQTVPSRPTARTPVRNDSPSLTWRDYALAALQGLEQGARLPITTCHTTVASRKGLSGTSTSCQTIGGY